MAAVGSVLLVVFVAADYNSSRKMQRYRVALERVLIRPCDKFKKTGMLFW